MPKFRRDRAGSLAISRVSESSIPNLAADFELFSYDLSSLMKLIVRERDQSFNARLITYIKMIAPKRIHLIQQGARLMVLDFLILSTLGH